MTHFWPQQQLHLFPKRNDLKRVLRPPDTNTGDVEGEDFESATEEGEYFKKPFKDVRTTFVLDQTN